MPLLRYVVITVATCSCACSRLSVRRTGKHRKGDQKLYFRRRSFSRDIASPRQPVRQNICELASVKNCRVSLLFVVWRRNSTKQGEYVMAATIDTAANVPWWKEPTREQWKAYKIGRASCRERV